ncbi:pentatricopeptide repeat-containing protein OTP51, chloroplastic-like [Magnolia sinica]|uniref:pentatricopeptide repeat-containing protein OTP51, chloroplastic-like n=1 Tax=Magnolia sinica TaxID=86752 RepID=UPI0026586D3F|nr:pentatricopeptide repeat-containing protein OTP51, chloroplastic-like [Magnolia sinica]
MLGVRTRSWCAHELPSSTPLISTFQIQTLHLSMRCLSSSFSPSFRAFSALALSFCRNHHRTPPPSHPLLLSLFSSDQDSKKTDRSHLFSTSKPRPVVAAAFVEHLESKDGDELGIPDPSSSLATADFRLLPSPSFEVKELEDIPEQWKRSRLAWLCKELPSHKPATLIRILNGQRKWMTQEDATYVAVHCMRIRENEAGFRVYKWMIQQHWFQFDYALATKLADYLGKDRKFSKCREIFNQIINQGHVPSESTFHILTVAYLSAPIQGCLEEACGIYNRMIQLGGYRPRLSLHNSLFRALVSKPGGSSKYYLKQAEFIFHNLVTSELEIHKEIYAGLIWLHSYQDIIDMVRIAALREEMHCKGIEESRDVLVSVMRACAKEGNVEEAERTWAKLLGSGCGLPSQAFVYRMEVYAKVGEPMKSLGIFREMQDLVASTSVVAYHKIIEVMSKAQETEIVETLMSEFLDSGLKPLMPSYIDMMIMYFNLGLHDKLESAFSQCLLKCRPNRTAYTIYLDSLVSTGGLEKAEEIFNEMHMNAAVGVNSRSCNIILGGYLASGQFVKAEKLYDMMCQKKYDIDPPLMEKIEYVLSLNRKVVKKPISLKLDKEQREILIGLLLGGVRLDSDEERRNHAIHFEFNDSSDVHNLLRIHIHERYYEWLNSASRLSNGNDDIPFRFSTSAHSYFGFYADQFWPKGRPMVPKLIHRWLSARVLAYWYMYGGHRSSSGDILLKLKHASHEDVERIVKTLKEKSLDCRVKKKGSVFWIGFQGSNAVWFWKLTEPYIVDDLKDLLSVDGQTLINGAAEDQYVGFDTESDSDKQPSGCSGDENFFDCFQHDSAKDTQD